MSAGHRVGPPAAAAGLAARLSSRWRAATGAGAGASLALGLLLAACTFVAVAAPRASLGYRSAALHHVLASLPVSEKAVLGVAVLVGGEGHVTPAALGLARSRLSAGLAASGLPLAARQQWAGLAAGPGLLSGRFSLPPAIGAAEIELLYRSSLAANAHLVAGRYPAVARTLPGGSAEFQVAVTQATARVLRIRVGSRLRTSGQDLVVTGIIGPVRHGSPFWVMQPDAAEPRLVYPSPDSAPYLDVAAFVGPDELAGLESVPGEPVRVLWSFPLDLGSVSGDQAAGLAGALGRISYLPVLSSLASRSGSLSGAGSGPLLISLSTGLTAPLSSFVAEAEAVQAALSLLLVSLGVVGAVVVLLGARLVTEHRGAELSLMQARGASLARLAAVVFGGCSLAVVPVAAVAAGAAVAVTPDSASGLSWRLGGLIVAVALAGPPLLAAWGHRRRRSPARRLPSGPVRRRAAAARRGVVSGALVCASVAGLVVLRRQGPAAPGASDLFTSAAPVLTAIPVAVLVMALLPIVTAWLLRLAARWRGVVAVLGLARGSAAAGGVLPVFALTLALSLIGFAAMERGAVARGNVVASWQQTGADAVLTVPATGSDITARARRRLAGVPGAAHVVELSVASGTSDQGLPLTVVVVDPARYAALTAGTPAPRFPGAALSRPATSAAAPGPVPVLVSPAARGMFGNPGRLAVAGRDLRVRFAGSATSMPMAPAGTPFAVVPRWALGSAVPPATAIAITGPRLDTTALATTARHVLPGSQLTLRAQVLAAISGAPLPRGGLVTIAEGGLAAAGMMLLVLLLTLVLGARSRERTLARMVTMGLAAGQRRRIVLVETLPSVIAAIVGGTLCALLLVPLVGPAIRLAAFTGIPVTVPLHADPVALAGAAAGLLVLALLTTGGQDWVARRRGAGRMVRLGE